MKAKTDFLATFGQPLAQLWPIFWRIFRKYSGRGYRPRGEARRFLGNLVASAAMHDAWRSAPTFFPALQTEPFSDLSIGISAVVMDRNKRVQRTGLNVRPHLPAALVAGLAQRSRRPDPEALERAGRFEMLTFIQSLLRLEFDFTRTTRCKAGDRIARRFEVKMFSRFSRNRGIPFKTPPRLDS